MAPKELRKSRTLRVNTASLVQFRKERGLTTTAFAREVGIQQGSMSHIENGTREPSPPVAKRMAEVLKVPLGAILAPPEASPTKPDGREPCPQCMGDRRFYPRGLKNHVRLVHAATTPGPPRDKVAS